MKIQLERTLPTCPPQLKCVACLQEFEVGKIRSLLCDRAGLIQGDLCGSCRKVSSLKQRLQTTETISAPKFYQWWFKRLAILSEATEEIERARFGSSRCHCKAKQLRIRFDDRLNG